MDNVQIPNVFSSTDSSEGLDTGNSEESIDLLFGNAVANSPYFIKSQWRSLGLGSPGYNVAPHEFLESFYWTLSSQRINQQCEIEPVDLGLNSAERIADARVLLDSFVQRELLLILENEFDVPMDRNEFGISQVDPSVTASAIIKAVEVYDEMLLWGVRTGSEDFRVRRRQVVQEIVWAYERLLASDITLYDCVMAEIKGRFKPSHANQRNIHRVNSVIGRWHAMQNKVKMIPGDKFGSYV